MSSFKKAIPQKKYRERVQPEERKKLGPLEKHSDYQVRARKRHQKEAKIKLLREKALNKNPDEYYIEMKNASKTLGGVTQIRKISKEDPVIEKKRQKKSLQDTASHNLNLLQYKRSILLKKMEKLQARLHLIGQQKGNHTFFVQDEEELDEFNPTLNKKKRKVEKSQQEEEREEEKSKLYKKLQKHKDNEKILAQAIQDLEMNATILLKKKDIDEFVTEEDYKNPNLHEKYQDVVVVKMKQERKK